MRNRWGLCKYLTKPTIDYGSLHETQNASKVFEHNALDLLILDS